MDEWASGKPTSNPSFSRWVTTEAWIWRIHEESEEGPKVGKSQAGCRLTYLGTLGLKRGTGRNRAPSAASKMSRYSAVRKRGTKNGWNELGGLTVMYIRANVGWLRRKKTIVQIHKPIENVLREGWRWVWLNLKEWRVDIRCKVGPVKKMSEIKRWRRRRAGQSLPREINISL